MIPSIGRIVHYVSYSTQGGEYKSQCRTAIITEVNDFLKPGSHEEHRLFEVGLCVLNPAGMEFNRSVLQDELPPPDKILMGERTQHIGGTWHWPERVPDDR